MSITNLVRDYGVNPAIVRMTSTDSYDEITTAGYLTHQMADFNKINGGAFQWSSSDVVLCYYITGWQFFTLTPDFSTLTLFIDGGVTPNEVQQNEFNYTLDTGLANAYVGTLTVDPIVPFAPALSVIFQPLHTNTGASTITINGTSAPIVGPSGGALTAGQIIAGGLTELIYSGNYSAFVLINSAIVPGTGTVGAGTINNLAWYASSGTTVSGLATANAGILSTNLSGVPSISKTVYDDLTINTLTVGQGPGPGDSTNVCFGNTALDSNITGNNLSAVGYQALISNTTGNFLTGFGSGALFSNITSNNSSAFGYAALGNNDGNDNCGFGYACANALGSISSGIQNCFYGSSIGDALSAPQTVLLSGDNNSWYGYGVCSNSATISGSIGIGALAVPSASTGSTSITFGPGIAIGSATVPVGFRGDGTAIPAGSANYWRVKVNGTFYDIPLLPDGSTIQWPASGTLATTSGAQQWINVTTSPVTIVPGSWYIANFASGITVFDLPTTAGLGTEFRIKGGLSGSGFQITQAAGQQINIALNSSTVGVTGFAQSTQSNDYLALTCLEANLIFGSTGFDGNIDLN